MTRLELLQKITAECRDKKLNFALARPVQTLLNGHDLDIVIEDKSLAHLIDFLVHHPELTVTSCYRRVDGVTVCLYGIDDGFLAIDFITKLALKGISYASVHECLLRLDVVDSVPVLHPVDMALVLFMTHGIKHKASLKMAYIVYLQQIFAQYETALSEKLVILFGTENALDIIDCIRAGDFESFRHAKCLDYFVWSGNVFEKLGRYTSYILHEMECRLLAPKIMIAFYGVDGSGKTSLINEVKKNLGGASRFIRHCHFLPILPHQLEPDSQKIQHDPHARKNRSAFMSYLKLVYLLARYWIGDLWPWRGSALFLYDRSLPDMLVDPKRYRYSGSMKILLRALRLAPKPLASILVDTTPETAQKRKSEVSYEETKRQADAYRTMITHMPNPLMVRGDTPLAQNAQHVTRHLIALLGGRVKSV